MPQKTVINSLNNSVLENKSDKISEKAITREIRIINSDNTETTTLPAKDEGKSLDYDVIIEEEGITTTVNGLDNVTEYGFPTDFTVVNHELNFPKGVEGPVTIYADNPTTTAIPEITTLIEEDVNGVFNSTTIPLSEEVI